MKAPKCRLCGHEHYGMAHVFATNKESATNTESSGATNNVVDAISCGLRVRTREIGKAALPDRDVPKSRTLQETQSEAAKETRTQNRRIRADYNAYQREYMRRKRAG